MSQNEKTYIVSGSVIDSSLLGWRNHPQSSKTCQSSRVDSPVASYKSIKKSISCSISCTSSLSVYLSFPPLSFFSLLYRRREKISIRFLMRQFTLLTKILGEEVESGCRPKMRGKSLLKRLCRKLLFQPNSHSFLFGSFNYLQVAFFYYHNFVIIIS